MSNVADLTGQTFGRWIVLGKAPPDIRGKSRWTCQCECGAKAIVDQNSLRQGTTKSCGCLKRDKLTIHGGKRTRLYRIWGNMKSRCTNPNNDNYCNYGGRGITICKEWFHDFGTFRAWSLANGYEDSLSIDRIDNDKGYSPDNCRWITTADQNRNQRKSHKVTYKAETKTIGEWASLYNIAPGTLFSRLDRGWDIERALTQPVR